MNTTAIYIVQNIIVPILIAVGTYIIVDKLGEWRKRQRYSRLGVAIIEALEEEVRSGIVVMTAALRASEDQSVQGPPINTLPQESWSGMSTIPDDVLFRIIETSINYRSEGFPLREIRIHCKNYFTHICDNYNRAVKQILSGEYQKDWRSFIRFLLIDKPNEFVKAANEVYAMLASARDLLESNSKKLIPK